MIAEALGSLAHDNPAGHAEAVEFDKAGAMRRIFIDSVADETTVDFVLYGQDGEPYRVFQYKAKRVDSARH